MAEASTVFVVDDDAAVRKALTRSLSKRGYRVETFASAEAFLDAYRPEQPGCLVLDVRMPGMSGLELQDQLSARQCVLPVLFITGHGDIPMSVRAIKNGAIEFLEKPYRLESLLERIDEAMAQVDRLRAEASQHAAVRERFARLTEREREVMRLLTADGADASNKVVARQLGISHRTVDDHRARVMAKMQARSFAELVTMAKQCEIG